MKILKSGRNVFLTGSAGTGKTFLLNQFIAWLKKNKIPAGITASTGIASTHLNGWTIHSWTGIGIKDKMDEKELKRLSKNEDRRDRLKKAKVLVIDEISMLDADRLDLVDKVCRYIKNPFLPFGGLQVVMCGDFFQLPPVDREKEPRFAYEASVWEKTDINVCYLDKKYRQSDLDFCRMLDKIRANEAGKEELDFFRSRIGSRFTNPIKPVRLYSHNSDVDAINDRELAKLSGKANEYQMSTRGPKELVNMLKKSCLARERLELKIGAIVMFIKNNREQGYVNGTLGIVAGFDEEGSPLIKTGNNRRITAGYSTWSIEEDGEVLAGISQLPLRLAWAITVHKSQGMSLDAAEMDLSRSFERGMGYVALSRVRELSGIKLLGINEMALKVSENIVIKDKEFRELSDSVRDAGDDSPLEEISGTTGKEASGADPEERPKAYSVEKIRSEFPKAYMPWPEGDDEILKRHFKSGKEAKTISSLMGRQSGSIRSRLKKLGLVKQ